MYYLAEDPAGGEPCGVAAQQECPHEADRADGVRGAPRTEEAQDRGHSARGHARTGGHIH